MKMTLEQTKLVGLTMELDLKTREYKKLCDELDELKKQNIDPNDERLIPLLDKFVKIKEEIDVITAQLKELKDTEN